MEYILLRKAFPRWPEGQNFYIFGGGFSPSPCKGVSRPQY